MKKQSLWSAPFVLVTLVSLFDSMSHMMLQFMISSYAVDIGISQALAATIVSLIGVTALVMRPAAGWMLDTFRQKRLLAASMAGISVAMLLYLLAGDFWTLLAARLVHGLCYGLSAVASVTIAGSLVPQERIGSGIAVFGMGNTFSVISATKIAQGIYAAFGSRGLFAVCLGCALCGFALSLLLPDVGVPRTEKHAFRLPIEKQALPFALLSLLFSGSQAINSAFMVIYFRAAAETGRLIGDAGITLMIWGIAIFICRPFVGKLYDKLGVVPAVSICMTCSALYMVALGLTPSAAVTYFCTLLFGGLGGCSSSVVQAAAYASSPQSSKGAANSTNLMGTDIGTFLGGVVSGWCVTAFSSASAPLRGYQISWVLCVIPLALAIAFCLVFRRSRMLRPYSEGQTA